MVFSLLLISLRSKEFAGFASRNRRRTAAEGKLTGGCCADAVEPQQGEPRKSTCFRKCFFSYIRLAASDIAFGSDIRFASGIVLRTVWRANIISLRGSAISLLRQQKYRAAHRAAYHCLFTGKEFYDIIRWGDNIMPDSILRCKSKDFAKQIVFLCRDVKSKCKESVLTSQLLRSG